MPLTLVGVSDAHFAWMLGAPAPSPDLRLPPGGVDEPQIIEIVRKIHARLGPARSVGGMIVVDGEVVGLCGNKHVPAQDGIVEIGYSVAASRRCRGYATQAVARLIDLCSCIAEIRGLSAETNAYNTASQRVLMRNDFVRAGERLDPADRQLILWRRRLE